jgi:hypothetical protein
MIRFSLLFSTFWILSACQLAAGQTPSAALTGNNWYVSPLGSDVVSCGSATSPCATINYVDVNKVAAGDTVHVTGTFDLTSGTCIVTNHSGTAANPITWKADPPGSAFINGQGNCQDIWYSFGDTTGYIRIIGFDMTGVKLGAEPNSGFLLQGGLGNYEVAYNTLHDFGWTNPIGFGAAMNLGPWAAGNYSGRTCSAHDNIFRNIAAGFTGSHDGYAIYSDCSNNGGDTDPTLYNNLIYNEGSIGIHLWHSANHHHIYNNTIDNTSYGILVGTGDQGGVNGAVDDVVNNIVTNCRLACIYAEDQPSYKLSASTTFYNNLTYGDTGPYSWGYNGTANAIFTTFVTANEKIGVDPKYTSAGTANFVLASGSPALGAGLHNSYTPTLDLAGLPRPNPPAIGAYETSLLQRPNPPTNLQATVK